MGRVLCIPFLLNLIRTGDPTEIRAFAQDQRLDRDFTGRGPLLNRVITRKIRHVMSLEGVPLPSVAPHADAERARAQDELQTRLDAIASTGGFDEDSVIGLAKAVRGFKDAPILEHAVQQSVGRLFAADYRATAESWAAAQLLDKAAHSMNSLATTLWQLTGEVSRAQRLLAAKVHNDRSGVHATGIAVHNLVHGFAAMRDLFATAPPQTGEAVLTRCLMAPASVLREVRPESSDAKSDIAPGMLVVLDLNAARQRDASPDIAFMSGSWSHCPAAGWVPALILAVWERARALPRPEPEMVGSAFRLAPTQVEAAHRWATYRGILGCNLVLQVLFAAVILIAPTTISHIIAATPTAADLVRIWGLLLLLLAALYAAGWFDPIYTRWPNVVGIGGRMVTALFYVLLGGGFLWFALYDAVFAGALAWGYAQAIRAELMSRP